jgi:hypothetical protein
MPGARNDHLLMTEGHQAWARSFVPADLFKHKPEQCPVGHSLARGTPQTIGWKPCICTPAQEGAEDGRGMGRLWIACGSCHQLRSTMFYEPPRDITHRGALADDVNVRGPAAPSDRGNPRMLGWPNRARPSRAWPGQSRPPGSAVRPPPAVHCGRPAGGRLPAGAPGEVSPGPRASVRASQRSQAKRAGACPVCGAAAGMVADLGRQRQPGHVTEPGDHCLANCAIA